MNADIWLGKMMTNILVVLLMAYADTKLVDQYTRTNFLPAVEPSVNV